MTDTTVHTDESDRHIAHAAQDCRRTSFHRKAQASGTTIGKVNPAACSGNGIPPPRHVICRQARRSFRSRPTTGNPRRQPGTDLARNRAAVTTTGEPSLPND